MDTRIRLIVHENWKVGHSLFPNEHIACAVDDVDTVPTGWGHCSPLDTTEEWELCDLCIIWSQIGVIGEFEGVKSSTVDGGVADQGKILWNIVYPDVEGDSDGQVHGVGFDD